MKYDIFISYASEDKDEFVRFLAKSLQQEGFNIWYDEFSLKLGDSLSEKIDQGLANSSKGIVILSKYFFAKNWTKRELRGLTARETNGENLILPIWHNITKEEIIEFSPPLADLVAENSKNNLSQIILSIKRTFEKCDISSEKDHKSLLKEVKSVIHDKNEGRFFLEKILPNLVLEKNATLTLFDIDDLTQINKVYSDDVGHDVLKSILAIINVYFNEDYGIHYYGRGGDDTFYMVFFDKSLEDTKNISESIRKAIENENWFKISSKLRVTCSFGFAQFNNSETAIDTVIRAALAMKKAKEEGKNKVEDAPKYLEKSESRKTEKHWS